MHHRENSSLSRIFTSSYMSSQYVKWTLFSCNARFTNIGIICSFFGTGFFVDWQQQWKRVCFNFWIGIMTPWKTQVIRLSRKLCLCFLYILKTKHLSDIMDVAIQFQVVALSSTIQMIRETSKQFSPNLLTRRLISLNGNTFLLCLYKNDKNLHPLTFSKGLKNYYYLFFSVSSLFVCKWVLLQGRSGSHVLVLSKCWYTLKMLRNFYSSRGGPIQKYRFSPVKPG